MEQIHLAGGQRGADVLHVGIRAGDAPVGDAQVAQLLQVAVDAGVGVAVAAHQPQEVLLVVHAQGLVQRGVLLPYLGSHLVVGQAEDAGVAVGVVFDLEAQVEGAALQQLRHAFLRQGLTHGEQRQLAARALRGLCDALQVLDLIAVVHGDGDLFRFDPGAVDHRQIRKGRGLGGGFRRGFGCWLRRGFRRRFGRGLGCHQGNQRDHRCFFGPVEVSGVGLDSGTGLHLAGGGHICGGHGQQPDGQHDERQHAQREQQRRQQAVLLALAALSVVVLYALRGARIDAPDGIPACRSFWIAIHKPSLLS